MTTKDTIASIEANIDKHDTKPPIETNILRHTKPLNNMVKVFSTTSVVTIPISGFTNPTPSPLIDANDFSGLMLSRPKTLETMVLKKWPQPQRHALWKIAYE